MSKNNCQKSFFRQFFFEMYNLMHFQQIDIKVVLLRDLKINQLSCNIYEHIFTLYEIQCFITFLYSALCSKSGLCKLKAPFSHFSTDILLLQCSFPLTRFFWVPKNHVKEGVPASLFLTLTDNVTSIHLCGVELGLLPFSTKVKGYGLFIQRSFSFTDLHWSLTYFGFLRKVNIAPVAFKPRSIFIQGFSQLTFKSA